MAKLKTNEMKKKKNKKTLRKLTAHQKYYKNYNSKKYWKLRNVWNVYEAIIK